MKADAIAPTGNDPGLYLNPLTAALPQNESFTMNAYELLVRITHDRAIFLGQKINERSNKRFVLNPPKRLQTRPAGLSITEYASQLRNYARRFGMVHSAEHIPTDIDGVRETI